VIFGSSGPFLCENIFLGYNYPLSNIFSPVAEYSALFQVMQKLTRSILIFCFVILGVDAAEAQDKSAVNIKYDKKNDITTVRLKPFKIARLMREKQAEANVPAHHTDIEISYSFPGQQQSKPVESVIFKFQVVSDNYTFLRPQTVMAVLDPESTDGRAFALGTTDYKSYPPKFQSIFEETLAVAAPPDAITKMAKAG